MGIDWKSFDENNVTEIPEGVEVLVSDGTHYDVAYYLKSSEYKWLKVSVKDDDVSDFYNFKVIKWSLIE